MERATTIEREVFMGYVVGVDGGGTKTAAVVADADERLAGRGMAGPANARSAGAEAASGEIARAVSAALQAAGASLAHVDAICLCLAGFDTELDLPVPREAMRLLSYDGPAIFENDVVGAWAGATGAGPGVVVIAGTGSTALGMNTRGTFWRTGGWDYVLDDEGSAYAIGLEGIRTAIRVLDGRAEPSATARLPLALHDAYGVEDAAALRRVWDSGVLGKLEIAAFATYVARAARQEDAAARQILIEAAHALGASATAVIRQLDMTASAFPVCPVGGVFESELVVETFRQRLAVVAPQATFVPPAHPPDEGAARLARQRLAQGDLGSWTLGTGNRHIRRTLRVADLYPNEEAGT
jgi:N-acetylglucosamine kinase-like BadF-type ATPase